MSWDPAALGPRGARLAYLVDDAARAGDHGGAARHLLDVADALVAAQDPRAAASALADAASHADAGADRRLVGEVQWRLGQLLEGLSRHARAASAYERAASVFASEGALADQVYALQANARTRSRTEGPAVALRLVGEAIDLARQTGEEEILADAMEQGAELAAVLGLVDDALARYREAGRIRRRLNDRAGVVRATIGQAECELDRGDHLRAITTLAPVETELEIGLDEETTGRGLALLARFHLYGGEHTSAVEHFEKAQVTLARAGADVRRADLMLAFARHLEREDEAASAVPLFQAALEVYERRRDMARIAPAAYSLARCYLERGDLVRADEAIGLALDTCTRLGDIEGLELCTEVGVRVAVRMGQGRLALERLRLAARVKGELGDYSGEARYLLRALEATLAIPDLDEAGLVEEFVEALRRSGTRLLAPGEVEGIAAKLADASRPDFACQILALAAQSALAEERLVDGARALAQAAAYAVRAHDPEEAAVHWDHAIAIGAPLAMPEVADWRVNRDMYGRA